MPQEWTKQNAKIAFEKVLTRAGWDQNFRDLIQRGTPQQIIAAIRNEGDIDVPSDADIRFFPNLQNLWPIYYFQLPPYAPAPPVIPRIFKDWELLGYHTYAGN